MAKTSRSRSRSRPARKPRDAYHHGNLRQALVEQAVATIRDRGVAALTLRDVGERLRVSRTALYRHFADKDALLAAVATEGFRAFRDALAGAWDGTGHTREGLIAMGRAYVAFATAHPAHYRVMFGDFAWKTECDPELSGTAASAFAVLVGAVTALQQQGLVRAGDPMALAVFAWSTVHGLATLVIDGQLGANGAPLDALVPETVARVWDALEAR